MPASVLIVDYGGGNVHSVQKKMSLIHNESKVSSSPDAIKEADKIILPGIGHFQTAWEALNRTGLIEPLTEAVMIKKKPILGICLGMQLMAISSEEGNVCGFGWVEAEVVRFDMRSAALKIPHMGWNTLRLCRQHELLKDIDNDNEFYFAHAYHWKTRTNEEVLAETVYGESFPSAIGKENIFGVQFHPEKSHDSGLKLLQNFVAL